jgi:hypothetical protein
MPKRMGAALSFPSTETLTRAGVVQPSITIAGFTSGFSTVASISINLTSSRKDRSHCSPLAQHAALPSAADALDGQRANPSPLKSISTMPTPSTLTWTTISMPLRNRFARCSTSLLIRQALHRVTLLSTTPAQAVVPKAFAPFPTAFSFHCTGSSPRFAGWIARACMDVKRPSG